MSQSLSLSLQEQEKHFADVARQHWLEERKTYLGGSDIAKLMGISKYGDALDVYRDKLGLAVEEEMPFYVDLGNFLEPAVAQGYANAHGLVLEKPMDPFRDPGRPFLAGNPDFLIHQDPDRGLEIKVVTQHALWTEDWGEEGSSDARLDYQLQCQWYMGRTGRHRWDLTAAFVDWDLAERVKDLGLTASQLLSVIEQERRTYHLTFDPELFAIMDRVGVEFWRNHIEARVAPPATALTSESQRKEIMRLAVKSYKLEAQATPEDQELGVQYAKAKIATKAAETAESAIKAKLDARIMALGTKRLKGDGWYFGTVEPADKVVLAVDAFAQELGDLAGLSAEELALVRAKHTTSIPATPYTQGWLTSLTKKLSAAQPA